MAKHEHYFENFVCTRCGMKTGPIPATAISVGELESLRAENARLREVVERASERDCEYSEWDSMCGDCDCLTCSARAALAN